MNKKYCKQTIKKQLIGLILLLLSLGCAGCGLGDSKPTETSLPPAAESVPVCESAGHSWVDATCNAAKTCSVCGATEGNALGHSWVEANYQAPKTCSVCGATEGDPLTAAFEEHGLKINVTAGETPYPYVTNCYSQPDKKTVAKLFVSGCTVIPSDETHEALEGYEWRSMSARILFDDDNANLYGMNVKTCTENYYDIEGWDASSHEISEGVKGYSVNFGGVDYTECRYISTGLVFSEWVDRTRWVTITVDVRVPIGYDGVVIGFHDASIEWNEGQFIYDIADENTLFFRMDVQEPTEAGEEVPEEITKGAEPDAGIMSGTVINTNSLNVREKAGAYNNKVGTLRKGDSVTVYEKTLVGGVYWLRIDTGWVSSDYIHLSGDIKDVPDGNGSDTAVPSAPAM